jgi:hypothetical protein
MKKELYIASRIHWRESLPQQTPEKPEQSRKKRDLQHSEQRLPPASQGQRVHLPEELRYPPLTQRHGHRSLGERRRTRSRIVKLLFWYLHPQRRTGRSSPRRQSHSTQTSSSSGQEWNQLPSPTMNQPRQEKNLFSENLTDEGTDAKIFGDITKPECGTRRSPCHEMKSWRWEKLQKNRSLGTEGIPGDVIVGKLKSRLSRKQDNAERTLSSDGT